MMRAVRLSAKCVRKAESVVAAPLRILIYHRVAAPSSDPWGLAVSPDNFDAQMAAIAMQASAQPWDAALSSRWARRPLRSKARFVITFDDGYADNLYRALPALERHGIPAVFFIATGFLDKQYFWWDRLAELVLGDSALDGVLLAAVASGLTTAGEADQLKVLSAEEVHLRLYGLLAACEFDDREQILDDMTSAVRFEPTDPMSRPLTSDELVDFARHPLVSIGCHTHRHSKLSTVDLQEAAWDIRAGAEHLQQLLGNETRPFAYPHGKHNKSVVGSVKAAGFNIAVTTVPRAVSAVDHALALPRRPTSNIPADEFAVTQRL